MAEIKKGELSNDWSFAQDPETKKIIAWKNSDVKGTLKEFKNPETAYDYVMSMDRDPLRGKNEFEQADYRLRNQPGGDDFTEGKGRLAYQRGGYAGTERAVADSNIVYSKTKMDKWKSSHLIKDELDKAQKKEIERIQKLDPNKLRNDIIDIESELAILKDDPKKKTLIESMKYKKIEYQKDLDAYVKMFGSGQKVKIDY